MGIDFDHYGLKSDMVFKGTTGAYKRICLFNSKWIVEKEKYPKYREYFGLKLGQDLGNRAGQTPPRGEGA